MTNVYQFKPKNITMSPKQIQEHSEWDHGAATALSYRNKTRVGPDTPCGCYFCLTTFKGSEVTEWTDDGETALCPRCDIDAVLPGVTEPEKLEAAHAHWFYGKPEHSPEFRAASEDLDARVPHNV